MPEQASIPEPTPGAGRRHLRLLPSISASASYPGADEYADAEARLVLLERRVAAQAAAIARVPMNMPIPRHVVALLATVPHELDGVAALPPRCQLRLVKLVEDVQEMVDDLTVRERELGGRIAAVRSARRAGPAPHLLDYQS